jgi:hypothetical protein
MNSHQILMTALEAWRKDPWNNELARNVEVAYFKLKKQEGLWLEKVDRNKINKTTTPIIYDFKRGEYISVEFDDCYRIPIHREYCYQDR